LKTFDVENTVDEYLNHIDWRVKENSNTGFSFSSLYLKLAGDAMAQYTLLRIYPEEIAKAHIQGDFHIHNLNMGIVGYCAGWAIQDILLEGFNGVYSKTESSAPRHFSTVLLQLANFVGTLQNEWAGAQAYNSLDTYLAPYVRKDGLGYRQVKQEIQQFIYNLNISSRWGGQTPFTNITFDLTVPSDLQDQPAVFGGKMLDQTYAEFQDEMNLINRAFADVMAEGDMRGRVFTFPIPTYNITKDFVWDSDVSSAIFRMTAKYGTPYFQNFINSELNPRDVRAMCCRLRLNLKELYHRVGGFFGFAEKTGSIGVVTLNLPRIGYLAKSRDQFFTMLERFMQLAKESLELKRKIVETNITGGLLPFTKRYLGSLRWHFSTIGLVGMNETCQNFLGTSIMSKEFMRQKTQEFQEETGHIYNLEATPAEGTSYRLARLDKQRHPSIISAGESAPYYTNSSHLPVSATDDLYWALQHQDDLQSLYTGGTVFHVFLGERLPTSESCKLLVQRIAESFKLPYYTLTPTFSVCINHGYLAGEHLHCPQCNQETEVYSRVVGYLRPVKSWNTGKQEEFRQRQTFHPDSYVY
jgi:ribonucleoside-triphosphate reductase